MFNIKLITNIMLILTNISNMYNTGLVAGQTPSPYPSTTTDWWNSGQPMPEVCGSGRGIESFIYGGKPAPYLWPWMAGLMNRNTMGRVDCGGALIDTQHVLTAAHCVYGSDGSEMVVRLGALDRTVGPTVIYPSGLKWNTFVQDCPVAEIRVHPDFSGDTMENDIAVIKLANPVELNPSVHPVCLPPATIRPDEYEGENATVIGWGRTGDYWTTEHLMQVTVMVWNNTECSHSLARRVPIPVVPSMLCAGYRDGGKDSCQGDSGGPIMWKYPDKLGLDKWSIIGVVSWGDGCAKPDAPGVYTRVSEFIDWIRDNTQN